MYNTRTERILIQRDHVEAATPPSLLSFPFSLAEERPGAHAPRVTERRELLLASHVPALPARTGIFFFSAWNEAIQMKEHATDEREARGGAAVAEAGPGEERPAAERKGIYLRTVYPLNPGIPHYLDFPRGA
jgi:hypothetical protein